MNDKEAFPKPKNIASEYYREYHYPDGSVLRIDGPVDLYLLDGGTSHRIVDSCGVTHRPERGWNGISWKPLPGNPPFDF